ncbi:MAG: 50S ribosomal protein L3 [Candidatus Marinimicrobia bacterium]|jgi:large subunit ribosomal protein L3|nr:50S ribosomal protein L3 [Candidatus Neomarinimicrobiota bacterium]|tara:strand:+ start:531 stop:1148 length:618 start_codon:yes stop_codon:yes gene_type:complete
MRGLIGRKIGMTQVYNGDGHLVPVSIVELGPCKVTQVKSTDEDGYEAVQLGFFQRKKNRTTKPMNGHYKKAGVPPQLWLQEFEKVEGYQYKTGQEFTVSMFNEGDLVSVAGTSKGRGFAGVIKRHNFHRQPETHGQTEYLRHPGSIGQASDPSRVFKGMKMAGRYGGKKSSVKNLEVIKVDKENNLLYLKGAVPGANKNRIAVTK